MKGDEIPRTDNLALHCQPQSGIEVDESGAPVAITREAFRVDDDGISTNWIEFNGGTLEDACMIMAEVRNTRKRHGVARFNIGQAIDLAADMQKVIKALHDPIEPSEGRPNPAHALLVGIIAADEELLDQLALLAEVSAFPEAAVARSKALFGR